MLESRPYKSELLKKALNNLLRQKDYHIAPPTRKNIMLQREYTRILRKKQLYKYTWKKETSKE